MNRLRTGVIGVGLGVAGAFAGASHPYRLSNHLSVTALPHRSGWISIV